jgi:hypothetical protein
LATANAAIWVAHPNRANADSDVKEIPNAIALMKMMCLWDHSAIEAHLLYVEDHTIGLEPIRDIATNR